MIRRRAQGGAAEARLAHTQEVAGSSPAPATLDGSTGLTDKEINAGLVAFYQGVTAEMMVTRRRALTLPAALRLLALRLMKAETAYRGWEWEP